MLSVTFACSAKAIGWNEMPLVRDTCVVPSNTVLDMNPMRKGDLGLAVISKLLRSMLEYFFM